jgi:glucose-1-phosphate thymidylyltransferase
LKALILAAGKGTRLKPLTNTTAKHLLPVANKPIIFFGIEQIREAGITDIGVVVSGESLSYIKESLGDGSRWGVSFTYIMQERPLGLAHAVMTAIDFIGDTSFLLFLGDNLIQDGVKVLVEKYNSMNCDAMIVLKKVDDPRAFGVAEIDDSGRVIRLVEKPKTPASDLALVGAYIFKPSIFNAISQIEPSQRGEYEITDAIQKLVDMGLDVETHQIEGWWLDTGTKEDLLKANQILSDSLDIKIIEGEVDDRSRVEGEFALGSGSRVTNSTIKGPGVIGKNVKITDSIIQSYTSIGDDTEIENTEIENTIILGEARIHNAGKISNCIIGKGVILSYADPELLRDRILVREELH